MSARKNLAGILEQWLRLTREEGAAIAAAGWPALKQIQSRKAALRAPLAEAVRQCAAEEPISKDLRAQVGRIISLLTRNGLALTAQLQRARDRQETLDQARRNLRRIRRTYSRPRPAAKWASYS